MKTYEVEIKRTSYVTAIVVAESPEEAEKLAMENIESGYAGDPGYADWEICQVTEK